MFYSLGKNSEKPQGGSIHPDPPPPPIVIPGLICRTLLPALFIDVGSKNFSTTIYF